MWVVACMLCFCVELLRLGWICLIDVGWWFVGFVLLAYGAVFGFAFTCGLGFGCWFV